MKEVMGLSVPTVHNNGTSKEELIQQLCDASYAIMTAIDVLNQAAPHGRDYYPQGEKAYQKAGQEHMIRISRLVAVKDEIDQIAMAISQQGE